MTLYSTSFFNYFRILTLLLLSLLAISDGFGQSLTQTIRGNVINKTSRQPVSGVNLVLKGTEKRVASDSFGSFQIENIPIGRHSITCSAMGYELYVSEEFILSSAKEIILLVELIEKPIELNSVSIVAGRDMSRPVNETTFVSARSFTAEETERIPASINDPGRMAMSYPGVKPGRDESENKLLIRGNSPFGVLWRLEGIDIPSPNHFAIPGSGGAGMTAFSAQLLSRSDFFTGGMPAEYGNTISSAFDIHFRQGNQQKREYRIKAGLVGIDLSTEGPLKNGRSSYLVNYRYSTLGLLSQMGFYLAGERTVNAFQDLSFNLVFHSKNGKNLTTVFGIGGVSKERHIPVKNPQERNPALPDEWEDREKPANMGAVGITHTSNINDRSFVKYVIALIGSDIRREFDTLNLGDKRFRYDTQKYTESRLAASVAYNYRFSTRTSFKTGLFLNHINFDFYKSITLRRANATNYLSEFTSFKGRGQTQTAQTYAQIVHTLLPGFTVNTGLHFMQLFLNNTSSLEPRISFQYHLPKRHTLSLAYGVYSQLLPLSSYFYVKQDTVAGKPTETRPNRNLKLPRSQHLIAGYQYFTPNQLKITIEVYYQFLRNVPVEAQQATSYYLFNFSDGFPEIPVVSRGKGRNKGIDVGIEKFFTNNYYFLLTASLFDSRYKTHFSNYLNSAFNDKFSTALTTGREFQFKNGSVLQIGFRTLFNGGFRYTPADPVLSREQNRFVFEEGAYFANLAPTYFRIDGRIAFRTNKKKYASNLSLDIQNVTGRSNVTSMRYNTEEYRLLPKKDGVGLVPVLSYQIDF